MIASSTAAAGGLSAGLGIVWIIVLFADNVKQHGGW